MGKFNYRGADTPPRLDHRSRGRELFRYLFTELNPNKDGPLDEVQRKSWTTAGVSFTMRFVSQESQSDPAYTGTCGGTGPYAARARPSPERDRAPAKGTGAAQRRQPAAARRERAAARGSGS